MSVSICEHQDTTHTRQGMDVGWLRLTGKSKYLVTGYLPIKIHSCTLGSKKQNNYAQNDVRIAFYSNAIFFSSSLVEKSRYYTNWDQLREWLSSVPKLTSKSEKNYVS